MKAVLTYDLPDEQSEFNGACDGKDLYIFLWDLDQRLRHIIKYEEDTRTGHDVADEIRDRILTDVDFTRIE